MKYHISNAFIFRQRLFFAHSSNHRFIIVEHKQTSVTGQMVHEHVVADAFLSTRSLLALLFHEHLEVLHSLLVLLFVFLLLLPQAVEWLLKNHSFCDPCCSVFHLLEWNASPTINSWTVYHVTIIICAPLYYICGYYYEQPKSDVES